MSDLNNKEKFSIEKWVSKIPVLAKQAKQLSLASHVCKFSHPDAKTSPVIATCSFKNDGYLHSGNIECKNVEYELDAFGNAAAIGTFSFLSAVMDDGRTVIEHLEQNTEEIRREFELFKGDYEKLRAEFLEIKKSHQEMHSDERIKQVYFPVGDDYHLLSLLTPSGVVSEVRARINEIRKTAIASKDEKNEQYGRDYDEVYDLTIIGFGGTKSQNISVLNSRNQGKAYLLSSTPPTLAKRTVIRPRRDFFYNTLQIKSFTEDFWYLHTLLKNDGNNQVIREKIKQRVNAIIDHVMISVYKLREMEAGWSSADSHTQLPLTQKIWLDDIHADIRGKNAEWLEEIAVSFARWIIRTYEQVLKNDRILLGDGEMAFLRKQVADALLEDKENFR